MSPNEVGQQGIIPPYNAGKSVQDLLAYYQSIQPNLNTQDFMAYADEGGFPGDMLAAMQGNEGFLPSDNLPTAGARAYRTVGHNMDDERIAAGDPFHATSGESWDPENQARRNALEWVINHEGLINNHGYLGTMMNQFGGDPNQIKDMRMQALLSMARDK